MAKSKASIVSSTLPRAETAAEKYHRELQYYDEIPAWYQDNIHIHSGYRPATHSVSGCGRSLFHIHNETVNIYSHLIPAFLFLISEILVCVFVHVEYPSAIIGDYLIFSCFILSASICLGLSAAFHTLLNHSKEVANFWLRLDFVGIVILILGNFISGNYMVFFCEVELQWIYWALFLFLGILTTTLLILPHFQGLEYRTFRLIAFCATGASIIIPIIHGIILFGFWKMQLQGAILYLIGEGVLFAFGAVVYTTRAPESLRPGKFDIVGCSHQIFHILVVLAAVLHLVGLLEAYHYNYHERVCPVHVRS